MIVLNNKCNFTKEEFLKYQEQLKDINSKENLVLCPSFLNISNFNLENFILGSQDVSSYEEGPHTGEVSATQLKSYGVKYSIVGHSERRNNESYEVINNKIKKLQESRITPILCVGETKDERETGSYIQIIKDEIISAIKDNDKDKIIIAYEPVWSIGTGIIPTNDNIEEVFKVIKEILPNNKILYGGSVCIDDVKELKKCAFIDGYLLGGLSLKVEELKKVLAIIDE